MAFDSVFNGDPRTTGVSSSGKATNGIDISSGQVYFKDDAVGGWQPTTGGSGGPVTSDNVTNESSVTGASVTDALNTLLGASSGGTATFTAGADITVGMVLMFDVVGGTVVFPANVGLQPNAPFAGVALATVLSGSPVSVRISGIATMATDSSIQASQFVTAGPTDGVPAVLANVVGSTSDPIGVYILGVTIGQPDDSGNQQVLIAPFFIPSIGTNIISISASGAVSIPTVTGNSVDFEFVCTTGNTDQNLALPNANFFPAGLKVIFIKVDSGSGHIVVSAHSGDTISGSSSKTVTTQWAGFSAVTDGANTWIVQP